jgi:FixJ family two-component response regulator
MSEHPPGSSADRQDDDDWESAGPADATPDDAAMERPTVYVVDDDEGMRKSLRWLVESVDMRVETYGSANEFLSRYKPGGPACLVLDVRMPGMSGLDLQERLRTDEIEIPIILITAYAEVPMAVRAIKSGAIDFLEKPVSDQVLLDHINKALAADRRNRTHRAEHQAVAERLSTLTAREREVMELVVEGHSSKSIATRLGVSFKTVEAHRAKIMRKMNASSVPHLIRMRLALPPDPQ